MAEEQAILDEVMREARKLLAATAEAHRKRTGATRGLARALLAAEKRGADRQKEADARIAEDVTRKHAEGDIFVMMGPVGIGRSIASAIRSQ